MYLVDYIATYLETRLEHNMSMNDLKFTTAGDYMSPPKYYYTWKEFNDSIENITDHINQWGAKYDLIIGINRGGLIPAVALSHQLGIPMKVVTWQDRDGGIKDKIFIPNHTLIVDDINDTGLTMEGVTSGFDTDFHTCALFERETSNFNVDIHARMCDNEWIVFPWEKE